MRKRIVTLGQQEDSSEPDWLNLSEIAEVEITSEDPVHPIESALTSDQGSGWRAAEPGQQMIRLLFTPPRPLRRIRLRFVEDRIERTQEYVLRWSADGGQSREIVRQQWNFSPRGANSETEDHHVELPSVTVLELSIIPDTSGGDAVASLARLQLA